MSDEDESLREVVKALERIATCLEQMKDAIGMCPHGYTICPVYIQQALRGT